MQGPALRIQQEEIWLITETERLFELLVRWIVNVKINEVHAAAIQGFKLVNPIRLATAGHAPVREELNQLNFTRNEFKLFRIGGE